LKNVFITNPDAFRCSNATIYDQLSTFTNFHPEPCHQPYKLKYGEVKRRLATTCGQPIGFITEYLTVGWQSWVENATVY